MATNANLDPIVRNDTHNITVTVQDSGGSAIDITGYTLWFTVREFDTLDDITSESDDTNAVIHIENTSHSDAANGITIFALSKAATNVAPKRYAYDVSMKDGSNNVTTIIYGYVDIIADRTRST